jgi:8-oxo-dGTP pyrophosphatase MutT (NUDIX family)
MTTHPSIRPASTVLLFRDSPAGPEVLMLRRNLNSDFVGGAYVFPGGAIDEADGDPALLVNLDDATASARLGVRRGGLAFYVGALRELFEEAGILLVDGPDLDAPTRAALRTALLAGASFGSLLRDAGVRLDATALHYYAHWVTPVGPPRRYDTRFFVAVAPADQVASHDQGETVADTWVVPRAALDAVAAGTFEMIFPTIKNLETVAHFDSMAALFAHVQAPRVIPRIEPRILERDGRVTIELDSDAL